MQYNIYTMLVKYFFIIFYLGLNVIFSRKNDIFYIAQCLENTKFTLFEDFLISDKILEKHILDSIDIFKKCMINIRFSEYKTNIYNELSNKYLLEYFVNMVGQKVKNNINEIKYPKKIEKESEFIFDNLSMMIIISDHIHDLENFDSEDMEDRKVFPFYFSNFVCHFHNKINIFDIFDDIVKIERFSVGLYKIKYKIIKLLQEYLKKHIFNFVNSEEFMAFDIKRKINLDSKFHDKISLAKSKFYLIQWSINKNCFVGIENMITDITKIKKKENVKHGIMFFNFDVNVIRNFHLKHLKEIHLIDDKESEINFDSVEGYFLETFTSANFNNFLSETTKFSSIFYIYDSNENIQIEKIYKDWKSSNMNTVVRKKESLSKRLQNFYSEIDKIYEILYLERCKVTKTENKMKIEKINNACFSEIKKQKKIIRSFQSCITKSKKS